MSTSHLDLWQRVAKTDPNATKQFSRAGGFKGTAINQTYLIRLATEQWGPMGAAWGVEILEQGLMQGAPILHGDVVIGHEQIHFVRIKLWHPVGEVRATVEHFGQTTFVGRNSRGVFTDEEAPKKSLTDAIGKALSLLGFAADVYLGLFDDNKYVNDRKSEVEEEAKAAKKKALIASVSAEDLIKAKATLEACKTVPELRAALGSLGEALRAATTEFALALAGNLEKKLKAAA